MARTLLLAAVAAILCALGAVSSSPVTLDKRNLQVKSNNAKDVDSINASAFTVNQEGTNEEFLEEVTKLLQPVHDDIDETEGNVLLLMKFVADTESNITQTWAAGWNKTLAHLADQAQALGIDVEDCIQVQAEEPFNDVLGALRDDIDKCLEPNLESVEQAVQALRAVGDKARDFFAQVKDAVSLCLEHSRYSVYACIAGQARLLDEQIPMLVQEADERSKTALTEANTLNQGLFVGPCIQDAANSRAEQASAIINAADQCIRNKLHTTEPQPEPTPEPSPEPTPEPQPEPTPEPSPEPTPEPQPTPEPKPEPTQEPQPEPTPEPTPEPSPEPTPEPQPEPTQEPQPEPTPEPQPEPTPEPSPEPTPEPQPEPTQEPQPEPTPEPQPEPTPEPSPKPQPTPEPQPEPTQEPQPEPQPVTQPQ